MPVERGALARRECHHLHCDSILLVREEVRQVGRFDLT